MFWQFCFSIKVTKWHSCINTIYCLSACFIWEPPQANTWTTSNVSANLFEGEKQDKQMYIIELIVPFFCLFIYLFIYFYFFIFTFCYHLFRNAITTLENYKTEYRTQKLEQQQVLLSCVFKKNTNSNLGIYIWQFHNEQRKHLITRHRLLTIILTITICQIFVCVPVSRPTFIARRTLTSGCVALKCVGICCMVWNCQEGVDGYHSSLGTSSRGTILELLESLPEGGKKEVAAVYNRKEMLVCVPMTDTLNIKFTFNEEQGV